MAVEFTNIILSIKNDVGSLTLNRPQKKNAFHAEMILEITSAVKHCSSINNLRAIVVKAEGNVFSAGADLAYMKSMSELSEEKNQQDANALFRLFLTVYECPIPIICLVNGPSYGGANGILAGADYVIASEHSVFSFSEVNLGIIPATISPFVLLKIGSANAMDVFLSGRRFDANEAKEIGLVNQVVNESDLEGQLEKYMKHILSSAPGAVRKTKALVRSFAPLKPAEFLDQTSKMIAEARISIEGQEGIKAFFEKRNSYWKK